jgi:hypothetical protein
MPNGAYLLAVRASAALDAAGGDDLHPEAVRGRFLALPSPDRFGAGRCG